MNFDVGTGDGAVEPELPALKHLAAMGYEYKTQSELNMTRRDFREVLLYDRLEKAPMVTSDSCHPCCASRLSVTLRHQVS